MARTSRWRESDIVDGVGEIALHKSQYLHDFVCQKMLPYSSYIWRGQRCDDWPLEPTLDRMIREQQVGARTQSSFRHEHLERFKLATRGRRGQNPPLLERENDWWDLGQHHGLATPLLDWTESPFVAAYFAFCNTGDSQTERRAIYALSRLSVQKRVAEIQAAEAQAAEERAAAATNPMVAALERRPRRPEVEFIRPHSHENQRLVSQAGLFTRAPDGVALEDWVASNFPGEDRRYMLMKITIPDANRQVFLKTLNRMQINHLTLFPDLSGAADFCNQHCRIRRY